MLPDVASPCVDAELSTRIALINEARVSFA
jgi:hypothetical protein